MQLFTHHKVNINKDGSSEVILYLDPSMEEFSQELGHSPKQSIGSIEQEAQKYVKNKLPNTKINIIKIVGGAMLLTTLAFAPINSSTAEAAQPNKVEAQQQTYTVKAGDSLWSIAMNNQTTVQSIKTANNLNTDILRIGQTLTIPNSISAFPTTITYTVIAGDTLSEIAAKHGTSVNSIRTANNLTSDLIRVGQTLTIPKGTGVTSPTPSTSQPTTANQNYTVVAGDTLSGIAAKHGTTVNAIRTTNNLTSDLIRVGQTLTIPSSETGTASPSQPAAQPTQPSTVNQTYTVVGGDTLSGIAARNGTTVNAIKTANNLTADLIRVGQTLTIPSTTATPSPSQEQAPPSQSETATHRYIVVSGDTLSGIAVRNGTTVDAIKSTNNLTSDFLRVGQALVIPSASGGGTAPEPVRTAPPAESSFNQEELLWLAKMIYSEARGESLQGQIAVGAVIMNRVNSNLFPNTVKDVIFEKSHGHYQFTPAGTGSVHNASPNDMQMEAARRAMAGEDPTNGSLFFYNPAKTSDQWVRSRTVSTTIGNHVFAF